VEKRDGDSVSQKQYYQFSTINSSIIIGRALIRGNKRSYKSWKRRHVRWICFLLLLLWQCYKQWNASRIMWDVLITITFDQKTPQMEIEAHWTCRNRTKKTFVKSKFFWDNVWWVCTWTTWWYRSGKRYFFFKIITC